MRAGRLSIVNKSDPMAPTHYILSAAVLPQPAAAISSRRLQLPPRRALLRMAVLAGAPAYRRKIQNMLKYFWSCISISIKSISSNNLTKYLTKRLTFLQSYSEHQIKWKILSNFGAFLENKNFKIVGKNKKSNWIPLCWNFCSFSNFSCMFLNPNNFFQFEF